MSRFEDSWLPPEASEPQRSHVERRRSAEPPGVDPAFTEPRLTLQQYAVLAKTGSGFVVHHKDQRAQRKPRSEWDVLFQRYANREIRG